MKFLLTNTPLTQTHLLVQVTDAHCVSVCVLTFTQFSINCGIAFCCIIKIAKQTSRGKPKQNCELKATNIWGEKHEIEAEAAAKKLKK